MKKMEKLIIDDCTWDSNDEIKFSPIYEGWANEYGNTDLMEVSIESKRWNDSLSITLSLDDMIEINKFLEDKIEIIKNSGFYKEIGEDFNDS